MKANACRVVLLGMATFLSVETRAQQTDTLIVNFDYNQSGISINADSLLNQYFLAAKKLFVIKKVELSGYCDNIGSTHYNDSLSVARVQSIKSYLCNKWVDASVISHEQGFGEKSPLNNNSTLAFRTANRRVEIMLQKTTIDTTAYIKHTITTDSAEQTKEPAAPPAKKILLADKIMDTATKAGSKIILENIIFYGGRHIPMAISSAALDDLLQAMQANPHLQIEIDGYVCCERDDQDGTDADTGRKDLSVQRAKYIYDYLKKNGIDKKRMTYTGFGASHKLYPEEKNYKEQTLNRRVEIKILNK
jgi:outer membrane protein OmpA-like peptidoglycan-associated protein